MTDTSTTRERVDEVLAERDYHRRERLIEELGLAELAGVAQLLDEDDVAGGPRRLLRLRFPAFAHVVWLAVRCPSTGEAYELRVPPYITTCRQAASWLAGFAGLIEFHQET